MTYTDIHTHHYAPESDVLAIENVHAHFDQISSDHPVSIGLHPWWLSHAESEIKALETAASKPNVLAIGECGLDKLAETDWDVQLRFFEAQVQIAVDAKKTLLIHCVRSFSEVIGILKGVDLPVVFHGVNKKFSTIEPLIEAGYYLSFGKALLSGGDTVTDTFSEVPLSQMFLETGDSNESIKEVYKTAAELRNESIETIAKQLLSNYHSVFKSKQ